MGSERNGPVALISGCSSGFGLLAAVELARAGFRVAATMRSLGKRKGLDEAAQAAGVALTVLPLDVTRAESIGGCVAAVESQLGPVEVLVNNAGYGIGGFFEDLTLDELRAQMETNFFGVAMLIKAVLPGMRARRRGRIINVSSLNGRVGPPVVSAYAASKFAVEGLSESLRHELRPFGVFVSLVEPGTFRTEIFEANLQLAARAGDAASPYYDYSQHMLALTRKRVAASRQDPRDVARAVLAAAVARRPRMRYVVGADARAVVALRALLPWRIFEWLVFKLGFGTIKHR